MNEEIKRKILDKIKEYDSIVLSRHIRPDGDALGSVRGLERIIELTYPEKRVYAASSDSSDYLSFLGPDDGEIPFDIIKSSLLIVLDTANEGRISYPMVLNAPEKIKIDHHIKCEEWNGIEWIEDERSSVSEMIADFYNTFKDELILDKKGAEALYTGIVTDSGRFMYSSTSPDTFRMASLLLSFGIEIETLEARLELKDWNFYLYREELFGRIHIEDSGLGWVYVDQTFQKKWKLGREDASESVSFLSQIKGTICYMAFIENEDGTIRVRLRSRFMSVDSLASRYHGGGHKRASGATCYSPEEMKSLIADADEEVRKYKESHDEWM